MALNLPQVAIVGRTNSGKSTLFNRLSESKKAITSSLINTTRDRNFATIGWQGREFTLVDTGGLDTATTDKLDKEIQKQVNLALKKSDVILFLVDGEKDLMPQDREMALYLNKLKKPVLLGINKIDSVKKEKNLDPEFNKLNFKNTALFSAINGARTGDLLDLVVTMLPAEKPENKKDDDEDNAINLAIIGRPNVGKSSLINAILGEERVIVSDQAHTTRDINDVKFIYDNKEVTLIDTAGMRRKSRVGKWKNKLMAKIEKEGVHASASALDKADVVLLVLEVQKRINSQDQTLVQLAINHRKKCIIVLNKWDLVADKSTNTIKEYTKYFNNNLSFAKHFPLIFVSALTKQRVKKILDLVLEIQKQASMQIPDEELGQLLTKIKNKYNPKQKAVRTFGQIKKELKLKSLRQVESDPIIFKLKTPTPKNVPPAIVNIIEKEIREKYKFLGTPIRIVVKK